MTQLEPIFGLERTVIKNLEQPWICDQGCTRDQRMRSKKYKNLCYKCQIKLDREAL